MILKQEKKEFILTSVNPLNLNLSEFLKGISLLFDVLLNISTVHLSRYYSSSFYLG